MNQIVTGAIILGRINYDEADRIITLLTPDQGKLRLMAKGVRRERSKLAGGIELFSVSHITFIRGRGEIGTLISTRLDKHYAGIVNHIDRVQLGYELIKLVDKVTEDEPGEDYFHLLQAGFQALDDISVRPDVIRLWFNMRLLLASGHAPNLRTDSAGDRLVTNQHYLFSFDDMTFGLHPTGPYGVNHIKLLRLAQGSASAGGLQKVQDIDKYLPVALQLAQDARKYVLGS